MLYGVYLTLSGLDLWFYYDFMLLFYKIDRKMCLIQQASKTVNSVLYLYADFLSNVVHKQCNTN